MVVEVAAVELTMGLAKVLMLMLFSLRKSGKLHAFLSVVSGYIAVLTIANIYVTYVVVIATIVLSRGTR